MFLCKKKHAQARISAGKALHFVLSLGDLLSSSAALENLKLLDTLDSCQKALYYLLLKLMIFYMSSKCHGHLRKTLQFFTLTVFCSGLSETYDFLE